jgi:hypothetical protein
MVMSHRERQTIVGMHASERAISAATMADLEMAIRQPNGVSELQVEKPGATAITKPASSRALPRRPRDRQSLAKFASLP